MTEIYDIIQGLGLRPILLNLKKKTIVQETYESVLEKNNEGHRRT